MHADNLNHTLGKLFVKTCGWTTKERGLWRKLMEYQLSAGFKGELQNMKNFKTESKSHSDPDWSK